MSAPPAPRRTRDGRILVGPSVRSRYAPAALVGLPIVALVLVPLVSAVLEQALARSGTGDTGALAALADLLLRSGTARGVVAFAAAWALLAAWALVPLALTRRALVLDPAARTLARRRGLRTERSARPLADVVYAVGDADREAVALVGLVPGGAGRSAPETEVEQWSVPHIGWDDAAFDGLRALQEACGLRPAPPRPVLLAQARRRRRSEANRELAARVGLPWRDEFEDPAVFQPAFDRARRVLGGKEPPAAGDPGHGARGTAPPRR
ncbi:hypothetical protein [Brachybacterium huguangmaarense]